MALRPTVMTIFDLEQRISEWQVLVRKLGQRAKVTKAQVAKLHSLLHDVREAGVSEVTPARRYELQELARTMADDIMRASSCSSYRRAGVTSLTPASRTSCSSECSLAT